MSISDLRADIGDFARTMVWYGGRKATILAWHFEGAKGIVVDLLKARRGTYQKPFLHVGMIFLTVTAVLSAPIIVNNYPTAASSESVVSSTPPSAVLNQQADVTNVETVTLESVKPRRDVIEYAVAGGDTLISIAAKFSQPDNSVDAGSIAYLNDFSPEKTLRPGEVVKIPPTSGVVVTVRSGDTISSLAKKYGLLSAQAIVDWPYNTFVDDERFTLAAGQSLVIPGGKAPEEVSVAPPTVYKTPPATLFAGGTGQFMWPVAGIITQYFSSFHPAIDIAGAVGDSVAAADSGRVVAVLFEAYGYGYHMTIDHGNGYRTLYAHLSGILVSEGDNVSRGQTIGLRGNTGRSTGPHTHFEIYRNGVRVNPLGYLK